MHWPIVLLYLQHNPRIQDWMRAQNISDVRALEQHYVRRLLQLAAAASASPPAWLVLMFGMPAAGFMSHAACRLCAAAPVAQELVLPLLGQGMDPQGVVAVNEPVAHLCNALRTMTAAGGKSSSVIVCKGTHQF